MKKINIIALGVVLTFVQLVFGDGATGKKTFTYTYDDNGNRIKRQYALVPCQFCRYSISDSLKQVDSIFNIVRNEKIEIPQNPTEIIKNLTIPELKNVFPNPTSNRLILQFTQMVFHGKLNVLDAKGNLLFETTIDGIEFLLDLSLLSPGEYFVIIDLNNGIKYTKSVIKT